MINPYNLSLPDNLSGDNGRVISLSEIPEYDQDDYDLSNPKDFRKYIDDIKKDVRGSFEYRVLIKHLREYDMMTQSGLSENLNGMNSGIKIEVHHTPFALEDIVQIVYSKRSFYHENLTVHQVAKEVMELHYKMIVGLYPLTQTEHQLVHNGYLFIPVYKVYGRYDLFISLYKPFIDPEWLDIIDKIEEYSKVAFDETYQKKLVSQSNIYLDTSGSYSLPIMDNLKLAMSARVDQIKLNSYMLPIFDDDTKDNPMDQKKAKPINLIYFD